MAKRRMFSLDIIDTDMFMDMPQSSRLLYYELCMRADDDGFIANPKKIMKMVGCSDDDFRVLITKQFILPFKSGVIVIKHWRIHNYIQKDRYKETLYTSEKQELAIDENGSYYMLGNGMDTKRIQDGYTGKDRLELEKEKGKSYITHTYSCHLKKTEKDSFCLDCQKKYVCKNKTSEGFLKVYGSTVEDYSKNKHEISNVEIVDYDWLNEESEDDNHE